MKFEKKALTIPDQIAKLKDRGMTFGDEAKAAHYLSNISYYRLSAFWYTLLDDPKTDHIFKKGTTFEMAIDTYVFDRKLRLLIFDEIERIEIALRTRIIYHFSLEFGNNWYEDKSLFRRPDNYYEFNNLLQKEMSRSNEVFIKHYRNKYTDPPNPPCWMTLELASFGQLSVLFKNLRNVEARKKVARHFGIHENVFESWLETLSFMRNTCAHHARLWNRKLPKKPIIPSHTVHPWLKKLPPDDRQNLVYLGLAAIRYLLFPIVPTSSFAKKLKALFEEYPNIPKYYMGFPDDWQNEPLWQA